MPENMVRSSNIHLSMQNLFLHNISQICLNLEFWTFRGGYVTSLFICTKTLTYHNSSITWPNLANNYIFSNYSSRSFQSLNPISWKSAWILIYFRSSGKIRTVLNSSRFWVGFILRKNSASIDANCSFVPFFWENSLFDEAEATTV